MPVKEEQESYKTTKEIALMLRVESQTIRRSLCINGHYLGLKPLKLPNKRLLWPYSEAQAILSTRNAKGDG